MKKFPKEVVVTWEDPGHNEDPYMNVAMKLQDVAVVGKKVRAAIYELKTETIVTTTVEAS